MTAPAVSVRTQVRDAVMQALLDLRNQSTARVQDFDVSPKYLAVEECTKFPTYCVVATDERMEAQTLLEVTSTMTLLVVIYVKDTADPRAKLDAAIEDAYDTMIMLQTRLADRVWKMNLEDITTDEGAATSQPHAQAVLRWNLHHRRRSTAV